MKRVLILCTGNSCRSQMAEAIWRARASDWECFSAGTEPAAEVHPQALEALAEAGISVDHLYPKFATEFQGQSFDLVVTVCDSAEQSCPTFAGARQMVHWPFDDPAGFDGTSEEVAAGFRRVRDEIECAIVRFLQSPADLFRSWMGLVLAQLTDADAEDRRRYGVVVDACIHAIEDQCRDLWARLTAVIREQFLERGWEWNGIYALVDRTTLRLAEAAGPPVCAELRRHGGLGTSGMCFDGIQGNQTLMTNDVSKWPGYVSCDGHSAIQTVASIVCPIRDLEGRVVAVWDLDSSRPVCGSDSTFFDRLFATLSVTPGATDALVPAAQEHPRGQASEETIRLDQFLKLSGVVETGGRAKLSIQGGEVTVNGTIETRRARKLRVGDVVEFAGETLVVATD